MSRYAAPLRQATNSVMRAIHASASCIASNPSPFLHFHHLDASHCATSEVQCDFLFLDISPRLSSSPAVFRRHDHTTQAHQRRNPRTPNKQKPDQKMQRKQHNKRAHGRHSRHSRQRTQQATQQNTRPFEKKWMRCHRGADSADVVVPQQHRTPNTERTPNPQSVKKSTRNVQSRKARSDSNNDKKSKIMRTFSTFYLYLQYLKILDFCS